MINFTLLFSRSILIFLGLFAGMFSAAGQNDTLVMRNGNVLVGEIKSLERGVLTLKTSYSDKDFQIEWDDVVRIKSLRNFIMSLSHGRKLDGSILPYSEDPTKVIIVDKHGRVIASLQDLIYIKPVKEKFFGRFSVLLSAGYTLTKANNSHQISIKTNVGYTSSAFIADAYFSAISNLQKKDTLEIRTSRMEGGLSFKIFLVRGWIALLGTDLLQNEEQKIKLRANTKAGVGNFVVRNHKLYLMLAGGGAWNYETYTEPTQDLRNNLEAFATIEINIYNIGDLDLLTSVTGYPSLTEWGRFRCDFNFDMKYDLPLDLFINLGFTLNYDNQPVAGASDIDYVLQTTIGWDL